MGVLRSRPGPADVPAGRARPDRGLVRRALPARPRPLPAGRAGPAAGDPPGARRDARSRGPLDAVDHVEAVLRDSTAASTDGAALDEAMDALQVAIAQLDRRITERYLRVG